jgi:hypothetical protein
MSGVILTEVLSELVSELKKEIMCNRLLLKGGPTPVTLPRIITPYCDSVDGTHARVMYQKLVTR